MREQTDLRSDVLDIKAQEPDQAVVPQEEALKGLAAGVSGVFHN